jgi:hypothetical protein
MILSVHLDLARFASKRKDCGCHITLCPIRNDFELLQRGDCLGSLVVIELYITILAYARWYILDSNQSFAHAEACFDDIRIYDRVVAPSELAIDHTPERLLTHRRSAAFWRTNYLTIEDLDPSRRQFCPSRHPSVPLLTEPNGGPFGLSAWCRRSLISQPLFAALAGAGPWKPHGHLDQLFGPWPNRIPRRPPDPQRVSSIAPEHWRSVRPPEQR